MTAARIAEKLSSGCLIDTVPIAKMRRTPCVRMMGKSELKNLAYNAVSMFLSLMFGPRREMTLEDFETAVERAAVSFKSPWMTWRHVD